MAKRESHPRPGHATSSAGASKPAWWLFTTSSHARVLSLNTLCACVHSYTSWSSPHTILSVVLNQDKALQEILHSCDASNTASPAVDVLCCTSSLSYVLLAPLLSPTAASRSRGDHFEPEEWITSTIFLPHPHVIIPGVGNNQLDRRQYNILPGKARVFWPLPTSRWAKWAAVGGKRLWGR